MRKTTDQRGTTDRQIASYKIPPKGGLSDFNITLKIKNDKWTDRHEDILIFLEDNISKLVKLKLASRATYKAYDQNYMNYLIAESIDDDIRMDMYKEIVKECYLVLRKKLMDAVKGNVKLKQDPVITEYLELMK